MSNYSSFTDQAASVIDSNGPSWNAINPESVARMRLQNRFKTGLDVAKYTAKIMREDMAAYDAYFSDHLEDYEYPEAAIHESLSHLPKVG